MSGSSFEQLGEGKGLYCGFRTGREVKITRHGEVLKAKGPVRNRTNFIV